MNIKGLRRQLAEIRERVSPNVALPEGCRTHAEWMEKLRRERELQHAAIAGQMSLVDCAKAIRELGALWPEKPRQEGRTPLSDLVFADSLKERIAATARPPHEYEPGGPCALPPVFGGMTNPHYCRDLTPEESSARAAWKEKYDPNGPSIREKLTLEERVSRAKKERSGIVYLVIGLPSKHAAAEETFLQEHDRAWEALMAEEKAARQLAAEAKPVRRESPAPSSPPPRPALVERPAPSPTVTQESRSPRDAVPLTGRDRLADYKTGIQSEAELAARLSFESEG